MMNLAFAFICVWDDEMSRGHLGRCFTLTSTRVSAASEGSRTHWRYSMYSKKKKKKKKEGFHLQLRPLRDKHAKDKRLWRDQSVLACIQSENKPVIFNFQRRYQETKTGINHLKI